MCHVSAGLFFPTLFRSCSLFPQNLLSKTSNYRIANTYQSIFRTITMVSEYHYARRRKSGTPRWAPVWCPSPSNPLRKGTAWEDGAHVSLPGSHDIYILTDPRISFCFLFDSTGSSERVSNIVKKKLKSKFIPNAGTLQQSNGGIANKTQITKRKRREEARWLRPNRATWRPLEPRQQHSCRVGGPFTLLLSSGLGRKGEECGSFHPLSFTPLFFFFFLHPPLRKKNLLCTGRRIRILRRLGRADVPLGWAI